MLAGADDDPDEPEEESLDEDPVELDESEDDVEEVSDDDEPVAAGLEEDEA